MPIVDVARRLPEARRAGQDFQRLPQLFGRFATPCPVRAGRNSRRPPQARLCPPRRPKTQHPGAAVQRPSLQDSRLQHRAASPRRQRPRLAIGSRARTRAQNGIHGGSRVRAGPPMCCTEIMSPSPAGPPKSQIRPSIWGGMPMALRHVRPLSHEDRVAFLEDLERGPTPEQTKAVRDATEKAKHLTAPCEYCRCLKATVFRQIKSGTGKCGLAMRMQTLPQTGFRRIL